MLVPDQHVQEITRVRSLLNESIDAKELSRMIRIGTRELVNYALKDTDKNADIPEVVYWLTELAEHLHPVLRLES